MSKLQATKKWTSIFAVLTLIIIIVLEWEVDRHIIPVYPLVFKGHRETGINVLIGILTGLLVTVLSSWVAIIVEKREFRLKKSLYALELYNSITSFELTSVFINRGDDYTVVKSFSDIASIAFEAQCELFDEGSEIGIDIKNDKVYISITMITKLFMKAVEDFKKLKVQLKNEKVSKHDYDNEFLKIIDDCIEYYSTPLASLKSEVDKNL